MSQRVTSRDGDHKRLMCSCRFVPGSPFYAIFKQPLGCKQNKVMETCIMGLHGVCTCQVGPMEVTPLTLQ